MAEADPGVLVRKSWAEKVDASVNAGDSQRAAKNAESSPRPSLFYDVRRIQIHSEARRLSSSLYEYDAYFVRSDGTFDYNFEFQVYQWDASTTTLYKYADRVWAVWRGRWEILEGRPTTLYGGTGLSVTPSGGASSSEYTLENTGVVCAAVNNWNGTTSYIDPATINPVAGPALQFGKQFAAVSGTGNASAVGIRTVDKNYVAACTLPTLNNREFRFVLTLTKNNDGLVTDASLSVEQYTQQGAGYGWLGVGTLVAAYKGDDGTIETGTFNAVYDTDGNL